MPRHSGRHRTSARAEVEWLIDNADAYRAFVVAIRGARHRLWISQLAIDVDCVAYDVPAADGTAHSDDRPPVRVIDELLRAARRGVDVRLLVNASLLLDTAKPLREFFGAHDCRPGCVLVRGVSRFPQLLHAKMLIADEADAFLIGSPFANGYWDDRHHAPVDARRPVRELGGRPLHDLSVQLRGAAVRRAAQVFVELWNAAGDVEARDRSPLALPAGPSRTITTPAPVRVLCTAPVRSSPSRRRGRMEILPVLLDGIARARALIYIEHQYLSARPVIDALTAALSREPALEVLVVLNQNPDVTAYRGWQNRRLAEAGLFAHPRVGVFALWTAGRGGAAGPRPINQLFVHSKVVTVDDRWAMVGSANLDGVSLHSYGDDFTGVLGRSIFRGVRNFDVAAVLDAAAPDDSTASCVRNLRTRLWAEHLGGTPAAHRSRPPEGWVARWRALAARNVSGLNRFQVARRRAATFVLPYSIRPTPRAQLADVGVIFAPRELDLCFEPSWLEVRFSPNWVRNMFG